VCDQSPLGEERHCIASFEVVGFICITDVDSLLIRYACRTRPSGPNAF
jgi:hypothetical protein